LIGEIAVAQGDAWQANNSPEKQRKKTPLIAAPLQNQC